MRSRDGRCSSLRSCVRECVRTGVLQSGAALLLLLFASITHAQDRDLRIHFRNGIIDPSAKTNPDFNQPLSTDDLRPGHRILQFDRLPDPEVKAQLKARGIALLNYIPDNAYWVSVDEPLQLGEVEAIAGDVLLSFQPEAFLRVSDEILAGDIPVHATHPDGTVEVQVLVFADVGEDQAAAFLTSIPGVTILQWRSPELVLLRVPEAGIADVAELDIVHWLEPKPAPNAVDNSVSAARIGVKVLQNPPHSLSGAGVGVGVWDAGRIDGHGDFGARVTVVNPVAASSHATHAAGTIGGSGAGDIHARGMAPAVNLYSYDWTNDINEMRAASQLTLSNHSYGVKTGWESDEYFGPAGFGQYSATTAAWDDVAFDTGLIIFKSAGNDRIDCGSPGNCDGPYDSIPTDGVGKNIITACATTDWDEMTSFSSWGPVDDGRVKPDLCANGTSLKSTGLSQEYFWSSGTSMASPALAGTGALLHQLYTRQNSARPAPHTMKALLINGARDLGRPGPDYEYGWGLVDAGRSADALAASAYVTGLLGVPAKETNFFPFEVPEGTSGVKATLVWTDPQGSPGAAKALVNDLNMVLISPDGTTHQPWRLNPASPTANATKTANAIDNVEQVVVTGPVQAGTWTARVTGVGTIPQGPQPFALVIDQLARSPLMNGATDTESMPHGPLNRIWKYYAFDLPPGATKAFVQLYGLTRDADLFVRKGLHPDAVNWDCRSSQGGAWAESCWFMQPPPGGGRFHVGVANAHFDSADRRAGYSVRASWLTTTHPIILTTRPTSVSHTTAMLNAAYDFVTPGTSVRFDYGLSSAYGNSTSSSETGRRLISGLQCGTTYHFRAVATTSQGTADGGDQVFSTSPCPVPVVQLSQGATLRGELAAGEPGAVWHYYSFDVPEGRSSAAVELFQISADPTISNSLGENANLYVRKGQLPTATEWDCRPDLAWNYPETCTFNDSSAPPLASGRWYVGVNNHATVENVPLRYSIRASWIPGTNPPIVTTGGVTAISHNSATLGATVNARGHATTARFEYGVSASYGGTSPSIDAGAEPLEVPVSGAIAGLQCNTTYHFRATAANVDGTVAGEDKTFRTSDCPIVAASLGNGEGGSFTLPRDADNLYLVNLPDGVTRFTAEIFDLSHDADLYVRKDQPADSTTFDCRSFNAGTASEVCILNQNTTPVVSAGIWYVSVRDWTEEVSLDYTIHVRWTSEPPDRVFADSFEGP